MPFPVFLTDDATRDLEELYDFIMLNDSAKQAEYVLSQIENTLSRLSQFPESGCYPQELLALGIRDYREIFFKPYRIIYRVVNASIYIVLIVDGRRDMDSLLQRRLLEA